MLLRNNIKYIITVISHNDNDNNNNNNNNNNNTIGFTKVRYRETNSINMDKWENLRG